MKKKYTIVTVLLLIIFFAVLFVLVLYPKDLPDSDEIKVESAEEFPYEFSEEAEQVLVTDDTVIEMIQKRYGNDISLIQETDGLYSFTKHITVPVEGDLQFCAKEDDGTVRDNYYDELYRYTGDAYFAQFGMINQWSETGKDDLKSYTPIWDVNTTNDDSIRSFCEEVCDYVEYCCEVEPFDINSQYFKSFIFHFAGTQSVFEPEAIGANYDRINLQNEVYVFIDEAFQNTSDSQKQETSSGEQEELSQELLELYLTYDIDSSFVADNGMEYRFVAVDRALGSNYYVLLGTDDNGKSCTFYNRDPFNGGGGTSTWLWFLDEKIGFAGLTYSGGHYGRFYRTEDGGESFTDLELPSAKIKLSDGTYYNPFLMPEKVYEEDGKLYLVVGQGPSGDYYGENGFCKGLYVSEDLGVTWKYSGEITEKFAREMEGEEILRRLSTADLSKAEGKDVLDVTEEWNTVVKIAELPEYDITMYGYNDEEYHDRGVAIQIGDDVNYFDWYYTTSRRILPELFWDDSKKQLQVALNIYTGTGASAQELHILQQYETGTLKDIELDLMGYGTLLGERLGFSYDEEKQLLALFDKENQKQLTRVDVSWLDGMKVEHVGAGEISYFRLDEQIWLVFTPGYSVEGWAPPQFDNMPELEVELHLTDMEDGTFELGEMRKVGIGETCFDVVMADAGIDFGEYDGYTVQLIMTEGQFYTEEDTVPGGGTYEENYEGEYILQVKNSDGEIVDEICLNQDWGYYNICPPMTINFSGEFALCIKDYNEDGFPDFTVGTYGSSSMNIYALYSVIEDEIVNIGYLTDCSQDFSIELKQEAGNTDIYTTDWNNATGTAETLRWKWNGEEYVLVE